MEWEDLVIENLPPDLFMGGYDIQYFNGVWMDSLFDNSSALKLLRVLIDKPYKYRYRRKELI